MKTEYTEAQYLTNYPDGVENHWWNLVRNDFILRLVRKLPTPRPAIIEVGCGRGVVVDYLRKRGVDCAGVELASVKPMPGIEEHVRSGTSALALPAEERAGYDVIMLLDVLEHLPDPQEFVASLISAYPNARAMIVTVPARAELWSNYDVHYGHFLRYSTDTLRRMLTTCGLSIASIGYFFHSIYPVALLGAKLNRERQVNMSVPRGSMRLVHKALSRALIIEARLLPDALPGTSMYAVCEIKREAEALVSGP